MSMNPLDLTGGEFLALYLGLLCCAAAASALIPSLTRPSGHWHDPDGVEDFAVLKGGSARLTDTVLTKLLARGAMTMPTKGIYAPGGEARGDTPAERSVLAAIPSAKWRALEERVRPHANAIRWRLANAGLMIDEARALRIRILQTAPYLLLLCLGTVRLVAGLDRDRPVGFLAILLGVTTLAAALRWQKFDRLTRNGRAAIVRARERSARLRHAPMRAESGLGVALFGTAVLVGSGLADFHQARAADHRGSSGCGDGGGGGHDGGGGGGGGCGGCGGD